MKVLVTSIGSTTSIGVVKFIRAIQRNIEITGTDTNFNNRIAGSFFVHNFFQVPLNTEPHYLDEMLRIVKQNRIDILIPVHDQEMQVLSNEAEKFKNIGCTVVVSTFSTVRAVNDKYAFAQLLLRSNILTPATYSVADWQRNVFGGRDMWMLKPIYGVSSRGIHKGNTSEISLLLQKNEIDNATYTIQEFIEERNIPSTCL
jgi:glutathione synthase/RimK-type ligase-like ATP-grasp enzyme